LSNAHFRCSSPEKDGTLPTKCREREQKTSQGVGYIEEEEEEEDKKW
jgi:hypothetical protein